MSASADAFMGIFGFKRVEGEQMKTIEETRRELFETWALDKWPSVPMHRRDALPVDHERYGHYVHLEHEWQAFNAALDAVVIKLPDTVANTGSLTSNAVLGYKRDCRTAIESTGLGLKVE